jgi:hypothetical protein
MGSSAPPPAARTWLAWYTSSRARRADPACCARPDGRARAGRPCGRRGAPRRRPSDGGRLPTMVTLAPPRTPATGSPSRQPPRPP